MNSSRFIPHPSRHKQNNYYYHSVDAGLRHIFGFRSDRDDEYATEPGHDCATSRHLLTTLLSLTPAQQATATTVFTNAATTAFSLRSQMKTARLSLTTGVRSDDRGNIRSLSTTIGGLVTQMVSDQASAKAAFYQILTPDQQSKLTQLGSQSHEMRFIRRGY